MTDLYVIESERRNIPKEYPNASQPVEEMRTGEIPVISVDKVKVIIDSKIREQDKLWDKLGERDNNKLALTKLSFGVFSIFVTGMLAILSIVSNAEELVKTKEFALVFCAALIGMGLINFSLIRNIIALKHSRILFLRQINCLRHAIDSCHFALIYGRFPKDKIELTDKDNIYFCTIGKHRKLPIDNDQFRDFHIRVFESSDNFTIFVITSLTVVVSLIPAAYLWKSGDSNIIGAASVGFVSIFVVLIIGVLLLSKKAFNHALKFNKFD